MDGSDDDASNSVKPSEKPKHVPPWENDKQLPVPLPVAAVLAVASVALCYVGWLDYSMDNVTGPYNPEMVNVLLHPEDTPLYAVEARTIALTGVGMAALRLALNHWAVDEDASSVVAILFSLFLAPIGVYGLYIFYGEGLPLNVIIAPFHTTLSESDAVARKWGPFFSATLGGGNIFNGYIAYELGWELAVYGFSNLTNLYHHTVFLLLSGLFCLSATYAYLGVAFMIMEISTIPLKIRRLTFRKDFSKAHPLLKKVYGWSTLLFAATFVVCLLYTSPSPRDRG